MQKFIRECGTHEDPEETKNAEITLRDSEPIAT